MRLNFVSIVTLYPEDALPIINIKMIKSTTQMI